MEVDAFLRNNHKIAELTCSIAEVFSTLLWELTNPMKQKQERLSFSQHTAKVQREFPGYYSKQED